MGQSTPGENIHNADQVLDLLLILLDVLVPAERFILAGESFGGYLIRGIARERRKDIRGMLFVCPLIKPGYRKGNVEPMEVFSYDVDDIESPYDMPALFLVGKNDTEVGYRDAFSLMDQYVDSTYVAISHTGHNMQIEAPDLFAANVTLWLENTQNVKKTFS